MMRRTLSEVRDVRVLAPSVTMTVGGGLDLREKGSALFLFVHQDGSLISMHRCMYVCVCVCVCVVCVCVVCVCKCGGREGEEVCMCKFIIHVYVIEC